MRYQLVVKQQALADLLQTVEWYESQDEGLGRRFLQAFDRAVARLENMPHANPLFAGKLRWRGVRPFQDIVIFHIADDRVAVIAVVDPRRDPQSIRRQLRGR